MTQDEKIDRFIERSFRDVADADYIAARICWRRELGHQFFWMGLQAVEKYLKGILLFHRKPVHKFSHGLAQALLEVKKLSDIDLKLRPEVEKFVHILEEQGRNRYFEWNFVLRKQDFLLLDELVWHLRVRCVTLASEVKQQDGKVVWTLQEHFKKVKSHQPGKNVNHIVIPFGKLEQISSGKSEARKDLIWKNFFFGSRYKRHIKFRPHVLFESSHIVVYPEIFSELNKLVKFSKNVHEHFQSNGKQQAVFKQMKLFVPQQSAIS
jgi:hypothetical protein